MQESARWPLSTRPSVNGQMASVCPASTQCLPHDQMAVRNLFTLLNLLFTILSFSSFFPGSVRLFSKLAILY